MEELASIIEIKLLYIVILPISFSELSFAPLLSLSTYWIPQGRIGCKEIDGKERRERIRPN